ncbi:MAG: PfaD family polyunsaturated fatty acid/polyketide biosynthesis protein [Zavarzinella sp.]
MAALISSSNDTSNVSASKESTYENAIKLIRLLDRDIFYNPTTKQLSESSATDSFCAPSIMPDTLGSGHFRQSHHVRYAYMAGAMANGIASENLVISLVSSGMLASFGAAGLSLPRIEQAIDRLQQHLPNDSFAINLIHSPNEQHHERDTVSLFLRKNIRLIEASAYLDITPHLVSYRLKGISRNQLGQVVPRNRVIGKVSRTEVATRFMSPAPERMVNELLQQGEISPTEAELAKYLPIADDVTVEADSGGHTDNRPALTLFPSMLTLRDQLQVKYGYTIPIRVGLGGGISTPLSAAAAFAMGADFLVTGSVNQACVESGSSDLVRGMLADATQADVIMAPAADMFEMGVKVQVLKRGTMFPMRAQKLYELYKSYPEWQAIPSAERVQLEKTVFRKTFEEVWADTKNFFATRDPQQITKAEQNPKHLMALVFRWYLGQSSRWANSGDADRKIDYQIWCGPAMGAFNEWVRGTELQDFQNRKAAIVARNLLYGAALEQRKAHLRALGFPTDQIIDRGPWPDDLINQFFS